MANKNLKTVSTRPGLTATPQSQKAVKGQKKNNAGGYSFTVGDLDRAKRFLILGSDSSYYEAGSKMSKDNADILIKLAGSEHSRELTDLIVEISTQGRAAKQDPALFALAIAVSNGSDADRSYAMSKISEVARTGSALFSFISYAEQFRGWGNGYIKAISRWYSEKTTDRLAYQVVKYRQREGWTHRDVFRKAHPGKFVKVTDPEFVALGEWILRGTVSEELPALVRAFEKAQTTPIKELPALIREAGLSWEMLPTGALKDAEVWDALLDGNVPLGALIRQLPRLTNAGLLPDVGGRTVEVCNRLTNEDELRRARIHPLNLLIALKTYQAGASTKGSSTWSPNRKVVAALDKAFYKAFKTVEPAGKRTLIGLDVSGSMGWGQVAGVPLKPSEAGAALALTILNTEPDSAVWGFADTFRDLGLSENMSLAEVMRKTDRMTFGRTDCAAPMLHALKMGMKIDTFIIITDNETWFGSIHPFEALAKYRRETGIDAKLIVLATSASGFSIADPRDPGMLDIAGFDSAVPQLITEFSKGL